MTEAMPIVLAKIRAVHLQRSNGAAGHLWRYTFAGGCNCNHRCPQSADEAELNLHAFADKWDGTYPSVSKLWQRHWEQGSLPTDESMIKLIYLAMQNIAKNGRCHYATGVQ